MVEEAYKVSVTAWGMQPETFWSLHPLEWWWQYDARRPIRFVGGLDEETVEGLWKLATK